MIRFIIEVEDELSLEEVEETISDLEEVISKKSFSLHDSTWEEE